MIVLFFFFNFIDQEHLVALNYTRQDNPTIHLYIGNASLLLVQQKAKYTILSLRRNFTLRRKFF